jgi:hypothetical protein
MNIDLKVEGWKKGDRKYIEERMKGYGTPYNFLEKEIHNGELWVKALYWELSVPGKCSRYHNTQVYFGDATTTLTINRHTYDQGPYGEEYILENLKELEAKMHKILNFMVKIRDAKEDK